MAQLINPVKGMSSATRLLQLQRLIFHTPCISWNADVLFYKQLRSFPCPMVTTSVATENGSTCFYSTEAKEQKPMPRQNQQNSRRRRMIIQNEDRKSGSGRTGVSEDITLRKDEQFNSQLSDIKSIHSLLEINGKASLSPQKASMVLGRIGELCNQDVKVSQQEIRTFLEDERFLQLGEILHDRATTLPTHVLLNSLSCILQLSPEDTFLTRSLETQVIWMINKMSASQLFKVYEMHLNHQETDLRQNVFNQALQALKRRWIEIVNPKELITLMYTLGDNDPKFMGRLEERCLDLCEQMNNKDLYRALYILAKKKHRNAPLLRALVYYLNKKSVNFDTPHLLNLTFACANLNIYDTNLLESITKTLEPKVQQIESLGTAVSLLQSFSVLRWRNINLLDVLSDRIVSELDRTTTKEIACLLLTCANLNYLPSSTKDQLDDILEKAKALKEDNLLEWLNVVWSCCVLRKADEALISSVLDPDFIQRVAESKQGQSLMTQLKLRNVNSAAQYDLTDYSGPFLPEDILAQDLKIPLKTNRKLSASVISALSNFAPAEKYLLTDTVLPMGYTVDVEMLIDGKGIPQPVGECSTLCPGHPESNKDAPKHFHRIAIKVLDFPDMTLSTVEQTGLQAMAIRHLQKLGYKVVEVPYTEFNQHDNLVKKVQYLEEKIKNAAGIPTKMDLKQTGNA